MVCMFIIKYIYIYTYAGYGLCAPRDCAGAQGQLFNHLGRRPIVLVWFPPLVYNVHLPFWSCLTDCMFKFGLTHKV